MKVLPLILLLALLALFLLLEEGCGQGQGCLVTGPLQGHPPCFCLVDGGVACQT